MRSYSHLNTFPPLITVRNMFPLVITVENTFPPLITVGNAFPLVITVGNRFLLVITVQNTFPLVIAVRNGFPLVITIVNMFPLLITVAKNNGLSFFKKNRGIWKMSSMGHCRLRCFGASNCFAIGKKLRKKVKCFSFAKKKVKFKIYGTTKVNLI